MSEGARKDKWDKLAIVLAPVGGLLTAGAIAIFGFVTSNVLNRRQANETNTRLYSELMSKREESESALRKDMFVSIINSFLAPGGSDLGAAVLNLELLAYNFHESLNLKPLFLDLKRRIDRAEVGATPAVRADLDDYSVRLERVAREIARKQLIVLEGVGRKFDRTIDMTVDPIGTSLEPATLSLDSIPTFFGIDVLDVDQRNREIKVGLNVETPDPVLGRQTKTATFVVSFFDFPMIDNTRLAHGQRCAIILNGFSEQAADVTLVLFPGEYASLKEKPYYSEVLEKVRSASEQAAH
ncbi:MAG TPA: hypothetical protein VFE28_15260 [Candidatus Krumholzibacteria bacterium]|nr:hypothetical protein [Candidatus Krumholzibacteria bacterium]